MNIKISFNTALDFGCGIGHLTQALGAKFKVVYGLDISVKMIELANHLNLYENIVKYIVNESDNIHIFENNLFDFVYTSLILQHMSPELMQKYLCEFVRGFKKNGALVFQVPAMLLVKDWKSASLKSLPRYHPLRIWNAVCWRIWGDAGMGFYRPSTLGFSKRWLYHKLGFRSRIEMYCLEESIIRGLMNEVSARIERIIRDEFRAGSEMISALFIVTKSA